MLQPLEEKIALELYRRRDYHLQVFKTLVELTINSCFYMTEVKLRNFFNVDYTYRQTFQWFLPTQIPRLT